jgi:transmembrane sensor
MTKDESHRTRVPVNTPAEQGEPVKADDEQSASRFEILPGGSRHVPRRPEERAPLPDVRECLRALVRDGVIDVDQLVARAQREQRAKSKRTLTKRLVASGAMMMVLSFVGIVYFRDVTATHVTQDEQAVIELADGSKVELNVRSAMRVKFTADTRELFLMQGEGLFKVRPDPSRPFRVHAGPAIFEAVGTQFDVRVTASQTVMAVVEGRVKLKPAASPPNREAAAHLENFPTITTGLAVTVDDTGRADAPQPVDLIEITAWRRSQGLVFIDATLAEIVAAFDRHDAKPKLIIADEELRTRRFGIAFDPRNSQELLDYLKDDDKLMLIRHGDEVTIQLKER